VAQIAHFRQSPLSLIVLLRIFILFITVVKTNDNEVKITKNVTLLLCFLRTVCNETVSVCTIFIYFRIIVAYLL